jgi:transposase
VVADEGHSSRKIRSCLRRRGILPIRSRRGSRRRRPGKLHADKGYGAAHLRRWLRSWGIGHRIARTGIETSQRPGRYRWVVERTVSWLAGCRRLHRCYERKPEHFLAFVGIAAALICHRRLTVPVRA